MMELSSHGTMEYVVPLGGGERRRLLDNISGYVAPGKLTALMGESGAGKTTLLNVLAGRVQLWCRHRGIGRQWASLPLISKGKQDIATDRHPVVNATVRRSTSLFGKMRQPASVPWPKKKTYVETCLHMCGLEAYADAVMVL